MNEGAITYCQSDGTWLARIDSKYRVYGLDVSAERAVSNAAMLLGWAVHPELVEVTYQIVDAPDGSIEPVRHPGRPNTDYRDPQYWLVVPVSVTRVGKWEYMGRFEGFYTVQASCDTIESTLDATRSIFLKVHNRLARAVAPGDFVFEALVQPEARNFDEDDDGGWSHLPGTTIRYRTLTEAEVEERRQQEATASDPSLIKTDIEPPEQGR